MQRILTFLQGKRTYSMAGVYGLDAVGAQLGWWQADAIRAVGEQVLTLLALRAAITPATK